MEGCMNVAIINVNESKTNWIKTERITFSISFLISNQWCVELFSFTSVIKSTQRKRRANRQRVCTFELATNDTCSQFTKKKEEINI